MTDAERARALSGATRACPDAQYHPYLDGMNGLADGAVCAKCLGKPLFILGERARRACPNIQRTGENDSRFTYRKSFHPYNCPLCDGDGWLSTLLEEPETCPCGGAWGSDEAHWGAGLKQSCHNTGFVQRWRIGLLIELLEEVGYVVEYRRKTWFVDAVFNISLEGDASLAFAACEALGAEVSNADA